MLRYDVKFKSAIEAVWKPEVLFNQVLSAQGRLFSSFFQWICKKAEAEGEALLLSRSGWPVEELKYNPRVHKPSPSWSLTLEPNIRLSRSGEETTLT